MVSTVRPNASATPRNPIPRPGKPAARTALPQPPKTSQKVPMSSASALFFRHIDPPNVCDGDAGRAALEDGATSNSARGCLRHRRCWETYDDEHNLGLVVQRAQTRPVDPGRSAFAATAVEGVYRRRRT